MPRLPTWAALAALSAMPLAYGIDTTQLQDPALEARYVTLTHELRCVQCQDQSIADSPVGLASDLRSEVHDMLLAGKTDEQIRDFMVARYGEFILFRPRLSARNAWLWLGPPLMLLLGLFIAVRIVRHRRRLIGPDREDALDEDIPRR